MAKKSLVKKEAKKGTNGLMFNIQGIFVNNFHTKIPKQTYDIPKCQITYSVNPLIKYKIEDDLTLIKIEITGNVEETKELILEAEVAFTYKVNNLKNIMTEVSKDKWDFIDHKNREILTTLFSVSLSTLRGIVYERVKGTIMDGKLIPLVDPKMFFQFN